MFTKLHFAPKLYFLSIIVIGLASCGHAVEDVSQEDDTSPTTLITPTAGLYNQEQTVSFSCIDDKSSCVDIFYNVDNDPNNVIPYTAPFIISKTTTVVYYSTDNNGNQEPIKRATYFIDTTQPNANADSTLKFSNITTNSISISWELASDGSNSKLQYQLFYSMNPDLDSVDSINTNGVAVNDFTDELTSADVANLDSAQRYYWNVLVKDLAGNIAPYTKSTAATQADGHLSKLVLPYGVNPGIAMYAGLIDNKSVVYGGLRYAIDSGVVQSFGGVGQDVAFDNAEEMFLVGITTGAVSNNTDMGITNYKSNTGLINSAFGNAGIFGHDNAAGGADIDEGRAITIDNSGNLLVVGDSVNATGDFDVVVWRVLPSGTLDNSFGTAGFTIVPDSAGGTGFDVGRAITLDANNNILVTGESYNGLDYDMYIWRLTATGQLDLSFDGDGMFGFSTIGDDRGFSIAVDNNGGILVAGETWSGTSKDMAVWRYDPAINALDPNFGNNGLVRIHNAAGGDGEDRASDLLIDNFGMIVVTGSSWNASGNLDMVTWRFDQNGVPDPNFNGNGMVIHDGAAGGNGHDTGRAIVVDDSNRLFIAGGSHDGSGDAITLWIYQ